MTAALHPTSYELVSGSTLGKYEILRKLAIGGMAEIYLAKVRGTAGFEKIVVLKRILPSVSENPAFVQMFLEEARLAATLQHANIADVYDVGEANGVYFFTMEYIHGEDVRSLRIATRARNERLPTSVALAIIQATAAALDHAHQKRGADGQLLGIVHRDVSSSNILVSYDGAIKLVDFGIARATAGETKTRTDNLKGKIPYMSPEQAQGRPLDRRSDLFSLGTVLYELTIGRRPFRGESDFEMMEQIVRVGAIPPRTIDPEYPPELEALVMKLLERDREQRYQSADALLHDLERFIATNNLWVTPTGIGRYMRGLFGDKITAWETAAQQGKSLGDHVAETRSISQASELVTPPSAFSAIQPLPSAEISVIPPSAAYNVRPRRRWLVIASACVATLALGGVGYAIYQSRSTPQAAASPDPSGAAPTSAGTSARAASASASTSGASTTTTGSSTSGSSTSATSTSPSTPRGTSQTAASTPGASTTTTGSSTSASSTGATNSASTSHGPPTTASHVTSSSVAAHGATSSGAAPHGAASAKGHPTKPVVPSKPTKPVKPAQPAEGAGSAKEQTWDPNSPFLPPSS